MNPQTITCRAAVCWGKKEPITIEEIQVEPPKSTEIRVKVLLASLCHTDILAYHGFPLPIYPRVLGHEGVGVVESVGNEVKDIKEGDYVIPGFIGECKDCDNCISGKTNFCLKYPVPYTGVMADGTSRMSIRGQKLYHFFTCSTWSEYMVMDANYAIKLDPNLNLVQSTFLSCGYSTGFGSVWKQAKVDQGSTVVVFGLGAVGLGAVEAARLQGASKIIGVEKNARKEEKARIFGITDFINPDLSEKSISEQIKELNDRLGVDYCIECTGFGPLINEALSSLKRGRGEIMIVGSPTDKTVQIDSISLLRCGILKGSYFGGLQIKSDLPLLFDICTQKKLHIAELQTHEISLEDINKVFEIMKEPDYIKLVIKI